MGEGGRGGCRHRECRQHANDTASHASPLRAESTRARLRGPAGHELQAEDEASEEIVTEEVAAEDQGNHGGMKVRRAEVSPGQAIRLEVATGEGQEYEGNGEPECRKMQGHRQREGDGEKEQGLEDGQESPQFSAATVILPILRVGAQTAWRSPRST